MRFQMQLMLIEKLATKMLQRSLSKQLVYHDYQHTREVVAAVGEIGRGSALTEAEIQLVQMAAWLHDLGHMVDYADHETESKLIAVGLLYMAGMEDQEISIIMGCIEATRMPQCPRNRLEEVMCDADLAHLSKNHFIERSELLRQEWKTMLGLVYTDEAWLQNSYQFLISHRYFTPYGQKVLRQCKAKNICRLMSLSHLLAA